MARARWLVLGLFVVLVALAVVACAGAGTASSSSGPSAGAAASAIASPGAGGLATSPSPSPTPCPCPWRRPPNRPVQLPQLALHAHIPGPLHPADLAVRAHWQCPDRDRAPDADHPACRRSSCRPASSPPSSACSVFSPSSRACKRNSSAATRAIARRVSGPAGVLQGARRQSDAGCLPSLLQMGMLIPMYSVIRIGLTNFDRMRC